MKRNPYPVYSQAYKDWQKGYDKGVNIFASEVNANKAWREGYAAGRLDRDRSELDTLFDDNKHVYDALPSSAYVDEIHSEPLHYGVVEHKLATRKETNVDNAEAITTLQLSHGAKIVSIVFAEYADEKPYHYKNVIGADLVADDLVVVECRKGLTLATVVDPDVMAVDVPCGLGELKHIIAKVDREPIKAVQGAEKAAIHAMGMSAVNENLRKFKENIGDESFARVEAALAYTTRTSRFKPVAAKDRGGFEQAGGKYDEDWQAVDLGEAEEKE